MTGPTFTPALQDPMSTEFKTLSSALENGLNPSFAQDVPGFQSVIVTGFRPGSIVADMDIQAQSTEQDKDAAIQAVKDAVLKVAATGSVAGYAVDTQNITFSPARTEPITSGEGGSTTTKTSTDGTTMKTDDEKDKLGEVEIIIIAVAAALVFVAFTVIVFKLWENGKTNSLPKSRLSNSSGSSTPSDKNGSGSISTEFSDLKKMRPATKFNNSHCHHPQENIYQPAFDNPAYAAPENNSVSYAAYIP